MDTGNPGGELLMQAGQIQKHADLQQAEHQEVQGFQRQTFFTEHPALSEKELDQFRWEQEEMVGAFLSEFAARLIKGAASPVQEVQPRVMPKQETVLPMQEEPDEKTLKKKQKQREQKLNAAKKKGILAASEYSLDMQKNYSAYMKKKKSAKNRPEKDIEFQKKCVSCFEVTPVIGDPVYVGENLIAAQEYMDNLKAAIDYFTLQNPEKLRDMTLAFQQKVGSAMKSYPLMEAAYENALMMNGLKRNGNRLVPIDENDLPRIRSNEDVRQSLVEQKKKNKEELDAVVAEEVEQYSKKKLAEAQVLNQQVRDEYKAKKGTSFIKTDRITSPYHFAGLDIFATMLEAHPEEYAANKEVLDSIMVYLRNIMETIPIYDSDFSLTSEMPADIEPEVVEAMHIRQEGTDVKKDNLQTTITMLEMSLKHILEGKPIYDKMAEFLYQFGYASQEYLDAQQRAADSAKMYCAVYKQKTKIWEDLVGKESEAIQKALKGDSRAFMLMQTEDTEEAHRYNQEVLAAKKYTLEAADKTKTQKEREAAESEIVRLYKPKFQTLYNEIMNMELESLRNMDPKEIMNRQGAFLRIGMENMHLCDCCRQIDPITGKSIKELVIPSPSLEQIYTAKIMLIQNYMVMGRMLSILEAYKKNSLPEKGDIIANEIEELKLKKFLDLGGDADQILGYAKETHKTSKGIVENTWKMLEAAYKKRGMEYYAGEKTESNAEYTPSRMEDKLKANMKEYLGGGTDEKEAREAYYKLVQMGKQEEADLLEAWYGLTVAHYHLAGEKKEINEAVFRSFNWAACTKGLQDMPEAEFRSILKLLAAGHLQLSREQMEEADITEQAAMEGAETQADLQAKNKEGLHRLLHAIAPHLDYLEEKYGHEVPQYEYVMAHLEEFHDDFLFCQVTENLISHFDALDSDVPEDVRLMHQIHFYNEVGIRIISLISQANLDETAGGSKLERIRMCRDTTAVAASLDYLNTHPKTAAIGV